MNNKNDAENTTAQVTVGDMSSTASPRAKAWTEASSDWTAPPKITKQPNPSNPPVMQAQNLSVRYGAQLALTDLTFTLHQGDVLGLLGLNGAGKSTLLNVLSGALAPDQGTVQIGRHELFEDIVASRLNIGYAPDKPAVFPEFRVTEYLHFIAQMRRVDKHAVKTSIDRVIDRCALGEVRKRVIGNLSSGYQQRVNIAQALIHSPKILILDEPANGLDPVQLMELRELIFSLKPDQATVFSSHLLSEVGSICNRVMLINDGRQILDTPIAALSNKHSHSFEVHLAKDSDLNLAELPGVSHACRIATNHWLVTGDSISQEHIQTMLHSRGKQASLITKTDNYLESLFRHLATLPGSGNSAKNIQRHR